jgi:protein involved in polysaccharide export with SLBB domain
MRSAASLAITLTAALALGGCAVLRPPNVDLLGVRDEPAPKRTRGAFADIPYASWTDYEPDYRFYPGDEIELTVPSAPELNKVVTVQPDGRIIAPLVGPVMAADRSAHELQADLHQAYSGQLLRPYVEVTPKAAPLKVFVGGEVDKPGVIDLVGDSDALRAVIQAGGFKVTADRSKVIVIRRGPDGRAMMRHADLLRGLGSPDADLVPLRRFDIVYVPRSGVANAGLWMQQYFRDVSPITFGFNYALGDRVVQ